MRLIGNERRLMEKQLNFRRAIFVAEQEERLEFGNGSVLKINRLQMRFHQPFAIFRSIEKGLFHRKRIANARLYYNRVFALFLIFNIIASLSFNNTNRLTRFSFRLSHYNLFGFDFSTHVRSRITLRTIVLTCCDDRNEMVCASFHGANINRLD